MTEYDGLVDRLRTIFSDSDYGHLCHHLCDSAADAIESLQAKVERLSARGIEDMQDEIRRLNAVLDKAQEGTWWDGNEPWEISRLESWLVSARNRGDV